MNRRVWLAGLLVLSLLLGGCAAQKSAVQVQTAGEPAQEIETVSAPAPAVPTGNVILMDGELVAVSPALKLSFPEDANAVVRAIEVEVGQRIAKGDHIAVLDDATLRQAVVDARRDLDRALADLEQAKADAEKDYEKAAEDADEKYEREMQDADDAYERERDEAQDALQEAQDDLQRTRMQPPTTEFREAEVNLVRALEDEAEAEDNYKQALDRPWEPQRTRDGYYKEWRHKIVDHELAELRFQDARVSLEVYYFDLKTKERQVERAEEKLAKVERDEVKRDDVEKETHFVTYERAVEDARQHLAEAQEDLQDAYLYAPWDGLVLSIDANVGEQAGGSTSIVTLLNVEGLYFVTENLSERHVARLRAGQQADITLRAYPDTVLTGSVDTVIPQTDRQADSDAHFVAYIRLDEKELDLLPGMTGRVEIVTDSE